MLGRTCRGPALAFVETDAQIQADLCLPLSFLSISEREKPSRRDVSQIPQNVIEKHALVPPPLE